MKKILILITLPFFILTACETAPSGNSNHETVPDKVFAPIEMAYTHRNLKLNDLDQMMGLLLDKLSEYKKTEDLHKLKEGVLIAYSRPDEDRTLDKIISVVKNPLEDNNEWINTIEALTQQSIVQLNDEKLDSVMQVTAGIILDNIIADFKPKFIKQYSSGGFETDIIEKIAQSKVIYSRSAKSERKLNLMRSNSSPSEIATRLIEQKNAILKQQEK